MAKSVFVALPRMAICPAAAHLVFYSWASSRRPRISRWHRHAHWQVEVVVAGPFDVHTEGVRSELRTGDVVLLPPGAPHEFRYPAREVRWVTIRFVLTDQPEGLAPAVLRADPVVGGLARALRGLLRPGARRVPARARAVAEHCFAGLVSYCYTPSDARDERAEEPPLVQRARAYIEENAHRRTTVEEMAEELGYSTGHISSEYRRCTGDGVKATVDRARANAARHMVLFSDHTITEVAVALDFPDVYSFSRFFRRMLGESPREFRRRRERITRFE